VRICPKKSLSINEFQFADSVAFYNGVEKWDAIEFFEKLNTGVFDGNVTEKLEKLSQAQLIELINLFRELPPTT
jgi:hypothetical protein